MNAFRLLMIAILLTFSMAACGDDDDDDNDTGSPTDDDATDDDATDDDAADDDATDDDATDDDATDDDTDDDVDDDALFEDDFESYTAGAEPPSPWTTDIVGSLGVTVIEAEDTDYGNCLEVEGSYVVDEHAYAMLPFTAVEADFTVAFDFWTDASGVGFITLSEDGGTTWGASLGNIADGSLYGHNGANWAEPCGTLTLGDWNRSVPPKSRRF